MIWLLRIFFLVVLATMLAVTGWATSSMALWNVPRAVVSNPWFVATLFDAYLGFLTFFCWVCWKETRWLKRGLWFVGILLLGNIAMAIYALNKLFRLPANASVREFLADRS